MHRSSRRSFCTTVALTASTLICRSARSSTSPNVVYILADDLGFGDVHFLNPDRGRLPTPNIDRLSNEGMTFMNAHSGSAVCTPTRYGILTGRYAWRSKLQTGVLLPYGTPLIPPNRLTVPAMLRSRGYAAACIGKWHLGWDWPKENGKPVFDRAIPGGPTAVGFDRYFGTDVPNYPPYCFIENDRTVGIPSVEKPASMYGSPGIMLPGWQLDKILPALVDRAGLFIRQQTARKHPFFLYLALTSPHTPLAVSQEWKGKSGLGLYGDWVMQTDRAAGEVLRTLEESGAAKNTLVIFTSDNGCAPYIGVDYDVEHDKMGRVKELEDKGHYPSARFRGYKSDIWEGGHHIPFIARWPGAVKAGARCDEVICLTDLMATLAELIDYKLPANAAEDSVSMIPALRGKALGRPLREATVHHSIQGKFAIRQGGWKLALCAGSGGWSHPTDSEAAASNLPEVQLYDMLNDPGETRNLRKEQPAIVQRLSDLLVRYIENGRSTPGARQHNDVPVDVRKKAAAKSQPTDD
jgi:arylsulfatase A-like enzyme